MVEGAESENPVDPTKEEAKALSKQSEQIIKYTLDNDLLNRDSAREITEKGFHIFGSPQNTIFLRLDLYDEEPDLPKMTLEYVDMDRFTLDYEAKSKLDGNPTYYLGVSNEARAMRDEEVVKKTFVFNQAGRWEVQNTEFIEEYGDGNNNKMEPGEAEQAGLALHIIKRALTKSFPPKSATSPKVK